MNPVQEAYILLQRQPESNVRIILDLLRAMPAKSHQAVISHQPFRRTGMARGKVHLPDDFDEHFDDLNEEIAESFYRGEI